MQNPILTIVMPAYNEEACIEQVVEGWHSYLNRHFSALGKTVLVVVNDGSKDKTGQILDTIQPRFSSLVVVHQPNGGHGNAVVHGYLKALEMNSEYIFQTDSDDQFDSDDLIKLWQQRSKSDFILGWRKQRFDDPFRLLITQILKWSIFIMYGTYIHDSNIPFRMIKGSFLQKLLNQLPKSIPFAPNIFLAVMAKKVGQNLFNIPITHRDRQTGEVSIVKIKLLKVCWQSFKELCWFRWELNTKVKNIK